MRTAEDVHDELLVMGCQDGDGESLIALVNRWQPRLLCHAMRRRASTRPQWTLCRMPGWRLCAGYVALTTLPVSHLGSIG